MKRSLTLLVVLVFALPLLGQTQADYVVGFNCPDVFAPDDNVTVMVKLGDAAPVAVITAKASSSTFTKRVHASEGAAPFNALEWRRTVTQAEYAGRIGVTLVSGAKWSGARGIVIYKFPTPPPS